MKSNDHLIDRNLKFEKDDVGFKKKNGFRTEI